MKDQIFPSWVSPDHSHGETPQDWFGRAFSMRRIGCQRCCVQLVPIQFGWRLGRLSTGESMGNPWENMGKWTIYMEDYGGFIAGKTQSNSMMDFLNYPCWINGISWYVTSWDSNQTDHPRHSDTPIITPTVCFPPAPSHSYGFTKSYLYIYIYINIYIYTYIYIYIPLYTIYHIS